MDMMILKDGTKILFRYSIGFEQVDVDKTIPELEKILTKDNLSKVQFANKYGKVYGKFYNMILDTLSKDYIHNRVNVKLRESN